VSISHVFCASRIEQWRSYTWKLGLTSILLIVAAWCIGAAMAGLYRPAGCRAACRTRRTGHNNSGGPGTDRRVWRHCHRKCLPAGRANPHQCLELRQWRFRSAVGRQCPRRLFHSPFHRGGHPDAAARAARRTGEQSGQRDRLLRARTRRARRVGGRRLCFHLQSIRRPGRTGIPGQRCHRRRPARAESRYQTLAEYSSSCGRMLGRTPSVPSCFAPTVWRLHLLRPCRFRRSTSRTLMSLINNWGEFVVGWDVVTSATSLDAYLRRYSFTGFSATAATIANTTTAGVQLNAMPAYRAVWRLLDHLGERARVRGPHGR